MFHKICCCPEVEHHEEASAIYTDHMNATVDIKPIESNDNFAPKPFARVLEKHSTDFYKLRKSCLDAGTLFEDHEFPAADRSLSLRTSPGRHFEWLRPHEIWESPEFFVEGYSRFDVVQGELGDCWLLAAISNLTKNPKLFFRVVLDDNSFEENYAGIFHFRFWQFGSWIEVVIDDRLPTFRGELMYMHSTERNEFWSALLEKAYAKLNGSYEALKGGSTCEAPEDFTGGVTEMYELKNAPSNLFNLILKGFERNSLMGCSIEPDPHTSEAETPQGLIRGHAYSITKAQMVDIVTPKVSGKIPMLRLRNPWGNEAEWSGAFSDKSQEWQFIPDEDKEELGLVFDNDGEFWMTFKDFLKYFDRIEICNLSPESLNSDDEWSGKLTWNMNLIEGKWVTGISAGGCRNYIETFSLNPQYIVSLMDPDEDDNDDKCTLIVALMQKHRRQIGDGYLSIGFTIYHLHDEELTQKPLTRDFFETHLSVGRTTFLNMREVSNRFKLSPGNYVIIPSTYEACQDCEFLIRVFSETSHTLSEF